jgi:hypothetical protein
MVPAEAAAELAPALERWLRVARQGIRADAWLQAGRRDDGRLHILVLEGGELFTCRARTEADRVIVLDCEVADRDARGR